MPGSAPGRPREFDRDAALEIAIGLFCRHGFRGVSIADLTRAMGIAPSSLYAAFGGKEALYREALAAYQRRRCLPPPPDEGGVRGHVEALLREAVRAATEPGYPGCMVAAGMLDCGPGQRGLADTLTGLRNARCQALAETLGHALRRGELALGTDTEALSRYVAALMQGIAIQAKDGAGPAELSALVDLAMARWTFSAD